MNEVLAKLDQILAQRRAGGGPDTSYVARLHQEGLDAILQKVGEEAVETLLAAKAAARAKENLPHLVHETADLWFHSLVMLSHLDSGSAAVLEELERRLHTSGLAEKESRLADRRE